MRTISSGVGLCVLSGTIATCFTVSHFRLGEHASAQNLSSNPKAVKEVNCVASSNVWFSPIAHELSYPCMDDPFLGQSAFSADVNGDGKTECFVLGTWTWGVLNEGQPNDDPASMLAETKTMQTEAGTAIVAVNVFPSAREIGSSLKSQIPGLVWARLLTEDPNFVGWRDCDNDGDLDFVTRIEFDALQSNGSQRRLYWFENTGYQSAPPANPYDLDGDGGVNAGDISVLLLNFHN
jgi:hypothetical protein